jgi:restriction system protein
MPVPDYESLMLPVLTAVQDGRPRPIKEVRDVVASSLGLTAEDRSLTIPSGSRLFDSRVHWSVTYMSQAGLIRRPKRGVVELTARGREVLDSNPADINNRLLSQFPEFLEFISRARQSQSKGPRLEVGDAPRPSVASASTYQDVSTPREQLDSAVREAHAAVAQELLGRVREQPPVFLERLVLRLLTAMGYGVREEAGEHLGRSGDQGLDGVVRQDVLGLDRVYVQAKRYAADHPIGRPDIQAFVGALHGAQADRGVFITTSRFTPDARDYAQRVPARLVLIDGLELADYMLEHNVGALACRSRRRSC